MAAVTRLGLHGGPRGLYGSFAGKAASAVQMSGTTGFQWAPTGALDVEATLAGSTGFAWSPTGALDQEATLSGSTGFTWTPSGNLVDLNAVVAKKAGGRSKARRRYIVEVDGNFIPVASIADAETVLQQIRDLAEQSAQQDVKTEKRPAIPKIRVKTATGKATTSAPLQKAIEKTQSVVTKEYTKRARQIAQDNEISVLLLKKIAQEEHDDDETAAMLLLM